MIIHREEKEEGRTLFPFKEEKKKNLLPIYIYIYSIKKKKEKIMYATSIKLIPRAYISLFHFFLV